MTTEDGKEVTVYTEDELQAQIKAKEDEIAKAKEKGENFGVLKAELDQKTKEFEDYKKASDEEKKKLLDDKKSSIINSLADGNKELAEKIAKEYDSFVGVALTETEIKERAMKAFRVAAPVEAPSAIDAFINGTGGRGAPTKQSATVEVSQAAKEVGAKMGITEEDYKKYGNK